jgi:hypothetical protein
MSELTDIHGKRYRLLTAHGRPRVTDEAGDEIMEPIDFGSGRIVPHIGEAYTWEPNPDYIPVQQYIETKFPADSWDILFKALGAQCSYQVERDGTEWVPVYLVGVDQGCNCIEVLPQPGTPFADTWSEANKPTFNFFPKVIGDPQPSPIKVTDFKRIRL